MRVTHQFHPLYGRDFEFVAYRQNWGEDRVHMHDENGALFSLPAGWTDVRPADPFAVIADGRCPFTIDGLLALADLIGQLRSLPADDAAVKGITPRMSRGLRRLLSPVRLHRARLLAGIPLSSW